MFLSKKMECHFDESNDLFKKIIEQAADHIMITNSNGDIEYVNRSFEETTGYVKDDVIGKNPRILKSDKHAPEFYQHLWQTLLQGESFHSQTTNKKKNGEIYIADQIITPLLNDRNEITHFVSVWRDRTEQVKLQESINWENKKLLEVVGFDEKVSSMRKFDGLYDFVVNKVVSILEAKVCTLMLVDWEHKSFCLKGSKGLEATEIHAFKISLESSVAGLVAQSGLPILVKDVKSDPRLRGISVEAYLNKSFICVPIQVHEMVIGVITISSKSNEQDDFNGLEMKILHEMANEVAIAIENIKLHKELHYLTITDSLTQLYNYRYFKTTLQQEIKRSLRYETPLSLIMIDIDHLKRFNDVFGHSAGNDMIKGIGRILKDNVRELDSVCRFGGDEFAIILPETDIKGAEIAALKICKTVEGCSFKKNVTVSIGVSKRTKNTDFLNFIHRTDRALYEAKEQGRNRVCVYG